MPYRLIMENLAFMLTQDMRDKIKLGTNYLMRTMRNVLTVTELFQHNLFDFGDNQTISLSLS